MIMYGNVGRPMLKLLKICGKPRVPEEYLKYAYDA
jgi:hypothetical protein